MVDYTLALAVRGFSAALYHVGGVRSPSPIESSSPTDVPVGQRTQQNVFYNAFTAPPTNQSSFRGWDTGAMYYGFLVVAEALGQRNSSQVAELPSLSNSSSGTFAGYVINEVRFCTGSASSGTHCESPGLNGSASYPRQLRDRERFLRRPAHGVAVHRLHRR